MSSSSAARRIAADILRERLEMDGMNTSALSHIFTEEPPPLDVFLEDSKYLNFMRPTLPYVVETGSEFRLSPIQREFLRSFEQIFKPELYIAMVEEFGPEWAPLPMKNMFSLEWAKGSGKDASVRLGVTRISSLLATMVSPQTYFNMASFDPIHLLNVAATATQARTAFFDPMKNLFKTNKYLSQFFHGEDPAEGSNRIRLKNNIYIISGNSLAENQEGMNLLAGVLDEVSAFKVIEEYKQNSSGGRAPHRGAEGLVNMLRSSASSRFPETYKVAQISYPRFAGDAIQKAMAEGRESIKKNGEASRWFVSGPYATWEVKPNTKKEDFKEHYDADPESAATMYECKPPKATNLFIRDETSIDLAFSEVREPPVQLEYYWGFPPDRNEATSGMEMKEGWQVEFFYADDFLPIDGASYCLHGDLAIKGDRAGIAMSHVKSYREDTEGDERPIIKNDFWLTFESDLAEDPPREVMIRWYQQLIWELIGMGFPIGKVTFDQFQSTSLVQTLSDYGIDSGLLSLDRNDKVYQNLKDIILDQRLLSYREEEGEDTLVIKEIKRLRKSGRKVDHLPSFSKDAADALAGSVFNAVQEGGEEDDGSLSDLMFNGGNNPDELDALMQATPPPQAVGMFGGASWEQHNQMMGSMGTPPPPMQPHRY